MKYVPPYGMETTDPDSPYINGDPSIGRQGSIPPAAAFEHPMRELVTVIDKNMLTPAGTDLQQVFKSIRSQRGNFAEDTGSVNTLSVAFDPPLLSYSVGLPIRVRVLNTNTGAAIINAGAGYVGIKKPNGSVVAAGDLPAGGLIDLVYDGTAFQMINFGGSPAPGAPAAEVFLVNIPYAVDTGTANNIVTTFSPALPPLVPGSICLVKIKFTNTGPTVMNAQSFGNKPVVAGGGAPSKNGALIYGDLQANAVHLMRYDGVGQWWIDPSPSLNANIQINCANNAEVADTFIDLSRKRVASNAYVTINLAAGVYGPITTYHVDADRMAIQGTMYAGAPDKYSFHKSGNTAGQRANDAANNIAMLRSRFGTEIRYTVGSGNCFVHSGPGQITVRNLLITGSHTPSNDLSFAIGTTPGGSMVLNNVCVWGAHYDGFAANASALTMTGCFSSAAYRHGFSVGIGGAIVCYGCGSYGGDLWGICVFGGASCTLYNENEVAWNGDAGVVLQGLGVGGTNIGAGQAILGNPIDVSAESMSTFRLAAGTAYGTTSPLIGYVGNANSIITTA